MYKKRHYTIQTFFILHKTMKHSKPIAKTARILSTTYIILFSSLIIHELGHYFAEEYLLDECGVTNIVLSFDLLLLERHGLTYIACTDYSKVKPYAILDLNKPTRPVFDIILGASEEGIGHRSLENLAVAALSGPLAELIYMTALVAFLYQRYGDYGFLRALYPLYLLSVFNAGEYDVLYVSPVKETLFTLIYYGVYTAFTMAYVIYNRGYYKKLAGRYFS
jgi:hypothetical protein